MATRILISGSGPYQWGDLLRTYLPLDLPEITGAALVSASLDGWAVEVVLADTIDVDAFVVRLERYLESDYDPWEVNLNIMRDADTT